MTTTINSDGTKKKWKVCRVHYWLYMRNAVNNGKETIDVIYCPNCWQKSIIIWDMPQKKFIKSIRNIQRKSKLIRNERR